ncbi:Exosome component 10-like protein [Leptotrombidium deliense]|uniref:Exosome complex component 10 homolog n=1 Tax=Leptotrombidium deliense TaxID=299467 RepID=A0A443SBZ7_9ACAR|nr:Exosome component 10-like protein [Leptotrombidium deliense]
MEDNKSESNLKDVQKSVVTATKCANSVPLSEFTFYSTFNSFSKVMQHEKRILDELMSSMVKQQKSDRSFEKKTEVEDKFDVLCDVNDLILDRVGHYLDDALGLKKKNEELVIATLNVSKNTQSLHTETTASWNKQAKQRQDGVYNLYSAKAIQRPQSKFKDKIDNRNIPFVPIIKEKPNSIKPLAILAERNESGEESFSHPYEFEIEKFEILDSFLEKVNPKEPKPIKETPLRYIDSVNGLQEMCNKLQTVSEFAVDLEHHSYRSFQGFTCLMQISTRDEDFIIDTLELRSELHVLNEIFTNPKIVKVFHGADMDIVWLQRDFGVYVVNLFDTGVAAKMLNFAHFSLAFLLKHYCNVETNKQFQLADWRMRPLPEDMLLYAREDTHYLLYIYDKMKNELISKGNVTNNLLRATFDRSRQVCLKKYEKPVLNEVSYLALVKKSKSILNNRQLFALKELLVWRDKIARVEDESLGYVLPNHMILHIAEVLPREQQGILACCNPVPPLVKRQLNEIHSIILKARELPLDKNENVASKSVSNNSQRLVDLDNYLHSRQDFSDIPDSSQHFNTLLVDGKADEVDYAKHIEVPKESDVPVLDERVDKLQSYFVSLNEQQNEIPKVPEVIKEETVEDIEVDDNTPIRDLMPKPKKKKKGRIVPDIPCNSVASAIYTLGTGQPSTSEPVASAVKPFDYQSFDYSKFASNSKNAAKNKKFFDPISKLNDNLNKSNPKLKNKRKNEMSSMNHKKRKN